MVADADAVAAKRQETAEPEKMEQKLLASLPPELSVALEISTARSARQMLGLLQDIRQDHSPRIEKHGGGDEGARHESRFPGKTK
eukprot:4997444-Pyramimonas_sp.AAC.1